MHIGLAAESPILQFIQFHQPAVGVEHRGRKGLRQAASLLRVDVVAAK
jgi:hypothetical protein